MRQFTSPGAMARGMVMLLGVVLLTLVTPVGGAALLLAWLVERWPRLRWGLPRAPQTGDAPAGRPFSRWRLGANFVLLYALLLVAVAPLLAGAFGRTPLPCWPDSHTSLGARSPLYCVLGRNYTTRQAAKVLLGAAGHMAGRYPGTVTLYLDAGFPIPGLPMPPHLSHGRGDAVDLAFFYRRSDGSGQMHNTTPAHIGYWVYEQPRAGEAQPCKGRGGWLRWDFAWLQGRYAAWEIDPERTGDLLRWLSQSGEVRRIFLEPHLKARLAPEEKRVRFQGCHAARHDDHVHVEIR